MYYIKYASVYICVPDCVLSKCYTSLHGNVHARKMQIIAGYFQSRLLHLILSI